MSAYTPVTSEVHRGKWRHRQLLTSLWVLEIELGSSGKAAIVLKNWACLQLLNMITLISSLFACPNTWNLSSPSKMLFLLLPFYFLSFHKGTGTLFLPSIWTCLFLFFFIFMSVCVPHVCWCPWKPEEKILSSGPRVTGSDELPDLVLGADLGSSGRMPLLTLSHCLRPHLNICKIFYPSFIYFP